MAKAYDPKDGGWRYGVTLTLSYKPPFCFRSAMSSESEQMIAAYFHAVRSQGKRKPPTPAEERMFRSIERIGRIERAASLHEWERQWG